MGSTARRIRMDEGDFKLKEEKRTTRLSKSEEKEKR